MSEDAQPKLRKKPTDTDPTEKLEPQNQNDRKTSIDYTKDPNRYKS